MYSTEMRPVAALTPATRNSRTHTDEQVKQIAASMEQFGWTMPVLIDEEGVLIAGHARVRAAKLLGWEEAPCRVAEGWTDEQKTAYQIADNKLSENSAWDEDILREQIMGLQDMEFSLDVLGFPKFQLEGFLETSNDDLFNLLTGGEEEETPEGFDKAKEPLKTSDGMVQFSVVIPVSAKKEAFAVLRRIIAAGHASNYSEAFQQAMEAADASYP